MHARPRSNCPHELPQGCNIVCAIPHVGDTDPAIGLAARRASARALACDRCPHLQRARQRARTRASASIDASPEVDWEIVFVDDDSADGTLSELRDLSRADARVRHLQRIGRRGLSPRRWSRESSPPARLTSPSWTPTCSTTRASLPRCCERLGELDCDIVVGSRYTGTGGTRATGARARRLISDVATRLTRVALRTTVSDPMSGFFMLKRDAFDARGPAPVQHRLQDPARYPGVGAPTAGRGGGALRTFAAASTAKAS